MKGCQFSQLFGNLFANKCDFPKYFEISFLIHKVLHYNTITSPQAPVSGVAKFGTISHFNPCSGHQAKTDCLLCKRLVFFSTLLVFPLFGERRLSIGESTCPSEHRSEGRGWAPKDAPTRAPRCDGCSCREAAIDKG